MVKVQGIILAAGASSRMGEPKWGALIGGKTFLNHILSSFNSAGIDSIIVVFRNGRIPSGAFKFAINPNPERGQLSSLKAALEVSPPEAPFIMQLVDRPLVKPSTLKMMIDAYNDTIVIPSYNGRKGHPVLFPPTMRNILLATDDSGGIRAGITAFKGATEIVETDDEAVLWNIDSQDAIKVFEEKLKKRL